jgi:hypothetical protein
MYAIYFDKSRFLTEERLNTRVTDANKQDQEYPTYAPYKRIVDESTLTMIEVTYIDVQPHMLDMWFHQQMQSMDSALATGTKKRVGRNGYDPSLIDEEDEDY